MRRSLLLFCLIPVFILFLKLPCLADAQAQPAVSPHEPMPILFLSAILLATYALVFMGVKAICKGLRADPEWSMARMLSENTTQERQDPTAPGKTIMVPVDIPSSSRLIALLGLIVLMATFLAIGTVMVWTLGRTGQVANMEDAQGFLWAGLSMFAPYLISQSKDAVKAFGCDPPKP